MKPVTFNGCFGRLHMPSSGNVTDTAVIICPSILVDGTTAYRSIRALAETIAAAGMPVLRFDYAGTGDSLDLPEEAGGNHLAGWQRNIEDAIDWMKHTLGVQRLVLCGFQIGATLAALVASRRKEIAGLALIDAVIEGRTLLRYITFESKLLYGDKADDDDLLLHELQLSPAVAEAFARLDLRDVALPAGLKVALFARAETRAVAELTQRWREGAVLVTRPPWAGLEPLFAFKLIEEAAVADFTSLMEWLGQEIPATPLAARGTDIAPARLRSGEVVETPFYFGAGERLFGILSEPAERTVDQVVIIGNCGHDPHYGPSRQATTLARRLAGAGVACLRLDFSGLGDSPGPPGKENVRAHVFEHDRAPELQAAVDALQARGYSRFSLQGTCSAAYHAFHGALADPRISALMLVNIPLFTLPKADLVEQLEQRKQSIWFYLAKMKNRSSWMHLLRGDRDVGLALRTQFIYAPRRVFRRLKSAVRRLGLLPHHSFAWNSLAKLSKRGVRTLFVFSDSKMDTEVFSQEFGPRGEGLAPFKQTEVKFVPGMDHGLMKERERTIAEELITKFATAEKR